MTMARIPLGSTVRILNHENEKLEGKTGVVTSVNNATVSVQPDPKSQTVWQIHISDLEIDSLP